MTDKMREALLSIVAECVNEGWDDEYHVKYVLDEARKALAQTHKFEPLTDSRIDYIAEFVVKSMPDGIRGFCETWGWQQFARQLLEACNVPGVVASKTQGAKPVAYVPIHPRIGPLWAMTTDAPSSERLPSNYPLQALYTAPQHCQKNFDASDPKNGVPHDR